MAQSNPTLELHERVLADLDRRDSVIMAQEAEARRVLEQALACCAADRERIEQERVVLLQAGKLYRRFMETSRVVLEADAAPPAPALTERPVHQEVDAAPPAPEPAKRLVDQEANAAPSAPVPTERPVHQEVDAAPPAPEQREMTVLRELRRQLWGEHERQSNGVKQSGKWTALEPVDGASIPIG